MNINRFKSRVGLCELREVKVPELRFAGVDRNKFKLGVKDIATSERTNFKPNFVLHGKPYTQEQLKSGTRSPAEQAAYNKAKNKEERDRMAKTIRTSRANVRAGRNRRSALAAGVPGALAAGAWMANQDSVEESCKSRIASLRESSIVGRAINKLREVNAAKVGREIEIVAGSNRMLPLKKKVVKRAKATTSSDLQGINVSHDEYKPEVAKLRDIDATPGIEPGKRPGYDKAHANWAHDWFNSRVLAGKIARQSKSGGNS